jgi:hypothetical protein
LRAQADQAQAEADRQRALIYADQQRSAELQRAELQRRRAGYVYYEDEDDPRVQWAHRARTIPIGPTTRATTGDRRSLLGERVRQLAGAEQDLGVFVVVAELGVGRDLERHHADPQGAQPLGLAPRFLALLQPTCCSAFSALPRPAT